MVEQFILVQPFHFPNTFVPDADGLEADLQARAGFPAKGIDWKADWTASTKYRAHDTVRYGGQMYIRNEGLSGSQ